MTTTIRLPLALAASPAGAALFDDPVRSRQEGEEWSYPVEVWDPPFDMASPRTTADYEPLDRAAEKWDLCVSFPHMKDAYWMAVDYGVIDEAKRQGVGLQLVEAGGYTDLNSSLPDRGLRRARRRCRDHRRDLARRLEQSGLGDPQEGHPGDRRDQRHLLATELSAKSLVSFGEMGQGRRVPGGEDAPGGLRSGQGRLVSGPPGAGWVEAGNQGFQDAVKDSADRDRRHQVRRHRQGGAAEAGRGHARGASRTSTTSSARR